MLKRRGRRGGEKGGPSEDETLPNGGGWEEKGEVQDGRGRSCGKS